MKLLNIELIVKKFWKQFLILMKIKKYQIKGIVLDIQLLKRIVYQQSKIKKGKVLVVKKIIKLIIK